MSTPVHTYGPTCLLYDPEPDTPAQSDPNLLSKPPKIRAQFFYVSSFPIDDPLTPLPLTTSSSTASQAKLPPQPFSVRDNIALEEAWEGLRSAVENAAIADGEREEWVDRAVVESVESMGENQLRGSLPMRSADNAPPGVDMSIRSIERFAPGSGGEVDEETASDDGASSPLNPRKRHSPPLDRRSKASKRRTTSSPGAEEDNPDDTLGITVPQVGSVPHDSNISGSPFVRAPVRNTKPRLQSASMPIRGKPANAGRSTLLRSHNDRQSTSGPKDSSKARRPTSRRLSSSKSRTTPTAKTEEADARLPVGVSRLHLVEFPSLQMKPIYWNPLHDISSVIRATWFYKNTMLPVEPDLANQLESGYMYMQPWTETWQDELNSCVENGAEAEMKIVHKLWPKEDTQKAARLETPQDSSKTENPAEAESIKRKIAGLSFGENEAAGSMAMQDESPRLFRNSSVIYVNCRDAQILRPSLLPSVSRGRRPLSAIRKGRHIGIPVVRGFNRQVWDKLHPSKLVTTSARNFMKMQETATREAFSRRPICYACQMEDKRPSASDLVLVIHGIGQKLSERVESFHFTHAINAFRRQVNIELNNDAVWPLTRRDLENIMVLPVNWRSTLSLEDADVEASMAEDPSANHFGLKDITPETLPAIRNLISDVMLDIPYYLSHHKEKMVQAVVKEANRIYRLWCQNNPGFQVNGRVHLIAHSLGSVMAMDILSQQPTHLRPIDFLTTEISQTIFEFDTKNVFFCGSPAGFFLLLNKANLLPRKGRYKDGYENESKEPGVGGEAGTYGCLPVDNLYNIMHETDPIAYRLNAAVDSDLANSLKPASVPSSVTSWLQSFSSVFRWGSRPTQLTTLPDMSSSNVSQRPSLVSKLPSNIELETHDFTREEIAETRMSLLNDNGQIDFYLSGGGGPLNFQYLNMLSAHSSYWTLQDFVRFLVIEIGRRQGRDGALVPLRAEKKKEWKRGRA